MKSFIRTKVIALALVGIIMGTWVASTQASREAISTDTANTNSFRSAFLGPDVWEANLSSTEIKQQLQEHFAQVIQRLEATNATSLLRALIRAEASSIHPWTKTQRRAALISLATNRQRQIARLRHYMNRGLFPQNEGQSISAVPIFVDRHQTHCAVGFLMHSDGKDLEVASIVETNNLVRINDVRNGCMIDWIRFSGLTQEEAALIQPTYQIFTSFADLSGPNATYQANGLVVSQPTFRSHFFDVTLPVSFQGNPNALQEIFDLGKAGIETSSFEATPFAGFLFGSESSAPFALADANLNESLYVGNNQGGLGIGVLATTRSNRAAVIEMEYLLRSEQGSFSQIALTSTDDDFSGAFTGNEQSASMILSQIYDGDTDALLGEAQLSMLGPGGLTGFDSIQLESDFVRIKTLSLIVGSAEYYSFFNEFETSAVPEPSSGSTMILIGAFAAIKRRRRAVSN